MATVIVQTFINAIRWYQNRLPVLGYPTALAVIAIVGLLLRLVHIVHLHYTPIHDMSAYIRLGQIAFSSEVTQAERHDLLFTSPGYYWLVGAVTAIFGEHQWRLVLFLQAALDTLAIVLFGYAGRRFFNPRVGILAAGFFAVFDTAIRNTGNLMTETLCGVLLLASLCAFGSYFRQPSATRSFICGLCLVLTACVRSNALPVLAVFVVAVLYVCLFKAPIPRTFKIRHALVMTITFALGAGLLSLVNSNLAGRYVSFIPNSEISLLHGHHWRTLGWVTSSSEMPQEWQAQFKGKTLADALPIYKELAKGFISEHPAYVAFTLFPHKIYYTLVEPVSWWRWQAGGASGSADDYPLGPITRAPLLKPIFLLCLGLVGMLVQNRTRVYWLFPALVAALILPLGIATIQGRYRYPAEIILILTSAAAADRLLPQVRFRWVTGIWMSWAIIWTGLAWIRFAGPNLLVAQADKPANELLASAVQQELIISAPTKNKIHLGTFDVHGGTVSDLAFRFSAEVYDAKGNPAKSYKTANVPRLETYLQFLDENGKPIAPMKSGGHRLIPDQFHFGTVSTYFGPGWWNWRVVKLPAGTRQAVIAVGAQGQGRIVIRDLEARGPMWAQ